MRVLLDTCVIIDLLQDRIGFSENARKIFIGIAASKYSGFMSASQATDVYYLMRRAHKSDSETRAILDKLFSVIVPLDTTTANCKNALPSGIPDYEDAVVEQVALDNDINCIITRNLKDYKNCKIPCYSPERFIENQDSHGFAA